MKGGQKIKTHFKPNGSKRERVVVRLASPDRATLSHFWKNHAFPDPYNPQRDVPFKSEQEFLEFVIRSVIRMGPTSWYIFKHTMNPDYPVG
jgi:hypothetical protein